jgi:hypothetical protein
VTDTALATILLTSGVFEALSSVDRQSLVPWLFDQGQDIIFTFEIFSYFALAISPLDTPFSIPCFHLLSKIVSSTVRIPFHIILVTLLRLGASRAVFDQVAWKVDANVFNSSLQFCRREALVYRLVALIMAVAR